MLKLAIPRAARFCKVQLVSLRRYAVPLICLLILALGFMLMNFGEIVFLDSNSPALAAKITVRLGNEASQALPSAERNVMELEPGRFRVSTPNFSNEHLLIHFRRPLTANYLMIRKGCTVSEEKSVSHLRISIQDGDSVEILGDPFSYTVRHFIPLPKNHNDIFVKVENTENAKAHLVLDEIGLYENKPRLGKGQSFYINVIALSLGFIIALGILLHALCTKKEAATYGTIYFFVLPIAIHCSVLFLLFSPEWSRDLRVDFASGTLQEDAGCNLNYGLHMASSVLQGKGALIKETPPWCRMPGYGFFLALSGHPFDLLKMAMNGVILQIALLGFSLSFFFWTALRIMSPFAASVASTIIAFSPTRINHLQIDSIMPAVILICSGVACLFVEKYYKHRKVPSLYHLLFHLSFAFWFAIRTDILPAWAIVSLVLYSKNRHSWKYFLIPAILALAVGLSWALFKYPFIGRFSMTTESIGASMMGGLWEVPHKFSWTPTDGSYFTWMQNNGQKATTKAGSDFAVYEVVRFYFTYPFYFFSLIWHKFVFFAKSLWAVKLIPILSWGRLYLLSILILSFALKYKRFQTFLLGWSIFLNAPVFFFFFSGQGRFYHAPTIGLLTAAIPLLLDREFYGQIRAHFKKSLVVLTLMLSLIKLGPFIDNHLICNDALRYWAPFLDPALSTLNVMGEK